MQNAYPTTWVTAAGRVGCAASFAVALLLVQSAFWSPLVPWPLKLLVGVIALLSAVRPAAALLIVAALAPLSHVAVTRLWHAYPFALSEAMVLAFFVGYSWQRRVPDRWRDSLTYPTWLFVFVVLASCAVQLVVLQIWHDYPLRYARSFLTFLATQYLTVPTDPRPWSDGRGFVSTAALMLEGIALMRAARTLCARTPRLRPGLMAALVSGGVTVALLGLYVVTTEALAMSQPLDIVIAQRWPSPAIPSLDTVGVYYMLIMFLAIGLATTSIALLVPGTFGALVSFVAMLLTRTRAAIIATVVVAAALLLWRLAHRGSWLSPARAAAVSLTLSAVLGVAVIASNPLNILAPGQDVAIRMRVLFADTALRMMATKPLTGVGVGQYEMQYLGFAKPELLRYDARKNNAHNYFLWIAAELGIVGLTCFGWIMVAALKQVWSNLQAKGSGPPVSLWLVGGLVGFITTWIIGQPISLPQVSYVFWVALGVAATPAFDASSPRPAQGESHWPHVLLLAAFVGLGVSVPIRAARDISETVDLSRVSYGFYNPGETDDHRPFAWAGPQIRFFMRASARGITVPVAALLPATPHGVDLNVLVNGRQAQHVTLTDRNWHALHLNTPLMPGARERYWQIDLNLTPIDVPRGLPDEERRIAVGEIVIDR